VLWFAGILLKLGLTSGIVQECLQNFDGETSCKISAWKIEKEMGG